MDNKQMEALKELLRVVLLGIVSFIATETVLESLLVILGIDLTPSMKVIVMGAILSVLRGIDKFLHEWGKEEEKKDFDKGKLLMGGLTRF